MRLVRVPWFEKCTQVAPIDLQACHVFNKMFCLFLNPAELNDYRAGDIKTSSQHQMLKYTRLEPYR